MKRIFTILCAVLVSFGLSAQTDAGSILITGNSTLSYDSYSNNSYDETLTIGGVSQSNSGDYEDNSSNTMAFNLYGGYFVMDGLAAGLAIQYSSQKDEYKGVDPATGNVTTLTDESSSMTFGPVVRYYVMETGAWAQLGYLFGSTDDGDDDTEEPSRSQIHIAGGYSIMLSDNVSLAPNISYDMITDKLEYSETGISYEGKIKSSNFGFGVGIEIYL
ncbi:MAG: hypothetical protein VX370_03295 [Bacteroidota bacterium]|nr:hypothetical protein [Bacteroidota bacterium]